MELSGILRIDWCHLFYGEAVCGSGFYKEGEKEVEVWYNLIKDKKQYSILVLDEDSRRLVDEDIENYRKTIGNDKDWKRDCILYANDETMNIFKSSISTQSLVGVYLGVLPSSNVENPYPTN